MKEYMDRVQSRLSKYVLIKTEVCAHFLLLCQDA